MYPIHIAACPLQLFHTTAYLPRTVSRPHRHCLLLALQKNLYKYFAKCLSYAWNHQGLPASPPGPRLARSECFMDNWRNVVNSRTVFLVLSTRITDCRFHLLKPQYEAYSFGCVRYYPMHCNSCCPSLQNRSESISHHILRSIIKWC